MKELIKLLVEVSSPSGYESEIRNTIQSQLKGLGGTVKIDALGNLILHKPADKKGGKRIMVSAHMDEIGIIATFIDENGFVRFTSIGGVNPQNLPGGRVKFLNGTKGVIGTERQPNRSLTPEIPKNYIDVGATSISDCPVKVGDLAVFDREFVDFGKRLVSKAMDDRIAVAIVIEAIRLLKTSPHDVYFVFSTQEEVGCRGAETAAYGIDAELGLAVDVTGVGDTPNGVKMAVSLGAGPTVKIRDGGMISDPRVVKWMTRTAEKEKIPYQREVLEGGTTDARAIQISRAGVPVGVISIPCRYIHSPSEMVDYDDVQNAVKFLVALLSNPIELA